MQTSYKKYDMTALKPNMFFVIYSIFKDTTAYSFDSENGFNGIIRNEDEKSILLKLAEYSQA